MNATWPILDACSRNGGGLSIRTSLFSSLFLVGSMLCLFPASASSQTLEHLQKLRRTITELKQDVLEARAEQGVLQLEETFLQDERPPDAPEPIKAGKLSVPDAVVRVLRQAKTLNQSHEERIDALKALGQRVRTERETAFQRWRENTESILAFPDRVEVVEAQTGIRWRFQPSDIFWTSRGTALVMLSGVTILLTTYLILLVNYRLLLRKRLRSSEQLSSYLIQFALLLPLILSIGLAFRFGLIVVSGPDYLADPVDVSREKQQSALNEQKQLLQSELADLSTEAQARHARLKPNRAKFLSRWELVAFGKDIRPQEEAGYEVIRNVLLDVQATSLYAKDASRAFGELQTNENELSTFASHLDLTWFPIARLALIVTFVGIALCPLWSYFLQRQKRKRNANTCPRCGELGQLKIVENSNPKTINCGATANGQACNYKFGQGYVRKSRLDVGTFGIVAIGKSQWMWMLRQLITEEYYRGLRNLITEYDVNYETETKRVIEGESPEKTEVQSLPWPHWFSLEDRDWLGRAEVGITLFDYSGEIAKRLEAYPEQYRRAVSMNGLLYFWDPSNDFDAQVTRLDHLLQNRKDLLGVEARRRPIAFCISRLDELPSQSPNTKSWIQTLNEHRLDQDEIATPSQLKAFIEARNRHVRDGLDAVFGGKTQGTSIVKKLTDHVGDNFRFFPMTTYGFSPTLTQRGQAKKSALAPFGILEPFLWIIHKNGFEVFVEETAANIRGKAQQAVVGKTVI